MTNHYPVEEIIIQEQKLDSESDLTQSLGSGMQTTSCANFSERENAIVPTRGNSSSLVRPHYKRKK